MKTFNISHLSFHESRVVLELLLTTHSQSFSEDVTTNQSTTSNTNPVGMHSTTDKPIEPAEQQSSSQPHLTPSIQQLLRRAEQFTKGTFFSQAMLAQEEKVRDAEAFGDKPRSYQETENSSEKSLLIEAMREEMSSLKANNTWFLKELPHDWKALSGK